MRTAIDAQPSGLLLDGGEMVGREYGWEGEI